MLLFGTTDGFANIHAPNERVVVDEFEKAVLAEAEFFGLYAAQRAVMSESVERCRPAEVPEHTFLERLLDRIERAGNRMPDPAILFLEPLRRS